MLNIFFIFVLNFLLFILPYFYNFFIIIFLQIPSFFFFIYFFFCISFLLWFFYYNIFIFYYFFLFHFRIFFYLCLSIILLLSLLSILGFSFVISYLLVFNFRGFILISLYWSLSSVFINFLKIIQLCDFDFSSSFFFLGDIFTPLITICGSFFSVFSTSLTSLVRMILFPVSFK